MTSSVVRFQTKCCPTVTPVSLRRRHSYQRSDWPPSLLRSSPVSSGLPTYVPLNRTPAPPLSEEACRAAMNIPLTSQTAAIRPKPLDDMAAHEDLDRLPPNMVIRQYPFSVAFDAWALFLGSLLLVLGMHFMPALVLEDSSCSSPSPS